MPAILLCACSAATNEPGASCEERVAKLDAQLAEIYAVIGDAPSWDLYFEDLPDDIRLARIGKIAPGRSHRVIQLPVWILSRGGWIQPHTRGGHEGSLTFHDADFRSKLERLLEEEQKHLAQRRAKLGLTTTTTLPVLLAIDRETLARDLFPFLKVIQPLGYRRLELVVEPEEQPRVKPPQPSAGMMNVVKRCVPDLGDFRFKKGCVYSDYIFRDCPIDYGPVFYLGNNEERWQKTRKLMVEAFRACNCDAEGDDIAWKVGLGLPERYVYSLSVQLGAGDRIVQLPPWLRWQEAVRLIAKEITAATGATVAIAEESVYPRFTGSVFSMMEYKTKVTRVVRQATGGLSSTAVAKAVEYPLTMPHCVERHGLTGTRSFDTSFTIDPAGKAGEVVVKPGQESPQSMADCIAYFIRSVEYPKADNATDVQLGLQFTG